MPEVGWTIHCDKYGTRVDWSAFTAKYNIIVKEGEIVYVLLVTVGYMLLFCINYCDVQFQNYVKVLSF